MYAAPYAIRMVPLMPQLGDQLHTQTQHSHVLLCWEGDAALVNNPESVQADL
jgi:hypothetical protein